MRLLLAAAVSISHLMVSVRSSDDFKPASDPNETDWIFVPDLSDEFESFSLDLKKWTYAGKDGTCYSGNTPDWCGSSAATWDGRAPSLFVAENANIVSGSLKLTTRWDPNNSKHFPHLGDDGKPIIDDDCDCQYETYTSSGVISKKGFQHGYFEVRAKVSEAKMSSAFWTIGDCHEIDVFETVGNYGDAISSCTHYNYNKNGACRSTTVDFDPVSPLFHNV